MNLYTDTVMIYEILRNQKFKRNNYQQYYNTNSKYSKKYKTINHNNQTRPMIKSNHSYKKY